MDPDNRGSSWRELCCYFKNSFRIASTLASFPVLSLEGSLEDHAPSNLSWPAWKEGDTPWE